MATCQFLAELSYGVKGGIDLPRQGLLCLVQRRHQVAHGNIPHDHEIDIASRILLALRQGAIHECHVNARDAQKRLPQDVHQAHGLQDNRTKLGIDGTSGIGAVISPPRFGAPLQDAGGDQGVHLIVHRGR